MKPMNESRITFLSRSMNEGFARAVTAAFISQLDPAVDELADIRTAVSEAVTNCIVHAYPDRLGPVFLTLRLYENGKIQIRVRDRGCGIPDVSKAMEPLFTTGGEERSGMGIPIMESFMSEVRILSAPGKGTTVHMKRKIMQRGGRA